jgi:hypothetical protein
VLDDGEEVKKFLALAKLHLLEEAARFAIAVREIRKESLEVRREFEFIQNFKIFKFLALAKLHLLEEAARFAIAVREIRKETLEVRRESRSTLN